MRYLLAIVAFMVVFGDTSFAQTEFTREYNNYRMGVGPLLGYKLGINTVDPTEGIKNDIGAASMPDFGATFYMPLDPDQRMGLFLDLVYANYAYSQKYYNSPKEWTDKFSYLDLGPISIFHGFTIGLNVGIPNGLNLEENPTALSYYMIKAALNTLYEF